MKKSKWFDGAKFVPAHVGVYEVKDGFKHWDGESWGICCHTINQAYFFNRGIDFFQSPTWRGIKK